MANVKLTGYIIVPKEDLEAVVVALPVHIKLTREEPGCLDFQVSQDINNKFRFNVSELFESQEAFEIHQARVKESAWGRITNNVERFYQVTACD